MSKGVLYVVATPIGNLDDFSARGVETLRQVDLIAAEDTRHSRPLLRHYGIDTPMRALHQYNEQAKLASLLASLDAGQSIALISDAGTPLISDPGFPLVRAVAEQGGRIVPVPGASAMVCALSAAGLPTDRFLFAGFPPRGAAQRRAWLQPLVHQASTLVFYESGHRVVDSLADMARLFGVSRQGVVARELTKLHETFLRGDLETLLDRVRQDTNQQKGEFVILIAGAEPETGRRIEVDVEQLLATLLAELPLKQAVALAARISGDKKNKLYKQALEIAGD
ncbi:MAG: 16S rRNA (cytidine(1402)-2'-O)-methyltransferase [Candidatus Thiodiazotropha sp. (ex Dulcina madagascariensis)]|nr:16S rRNA (cytidine(1402)-2'-O)-methyltransferase [Candidatus Thiodiazotropha sp. (ex Dulcina madagascariensis)]MCU7927104.1 16S rRNA (cytidine(1402)-2'-O)-methyltransferase [Candidatus Thiodiazotropha sp. (ex Dulcina madagascariensis)]